jgi:hypothetical protein
MRVHCCEKDLPTIDVVWIGKDNKTIPVCSDHTYVVHLFGELKRLMADIPDENRPVTQEKADSPREFGGDR